MCFRPLALSEKANIQSAAYAAAALSISPIKHLRVASRGTSSTWQLWVRNQVLLAGPSVLLSPHMPVLFTGTPAPARSLSCSSRSAPAQPAALGQSLGRRVEREEVGLILQDGLQRSTPFQPAPGRWHGVAHRACSAASAEGWPCIRAVAPCFSQKLRPAKLSIASDRCFFICSVTRSVLGIFLCSLLSIVVLSKEL